MQTGATLVTDVSEVHQLDDAVWQALTTVHQHLAEGLGKARRYPPEVTVFAAIEDDSEQAWSDLAQLYGGPGKMVVLLRKLITDPPPNWQLAQRSAAHQMVLARRLPKDRRPIGMRRLRDADLPEMLALAELTKPGPFHRRTSELGGYVGVFDRGRLVAMAGQRFRTVGYTEISAVCVHPDVRNRGMGTAVSLEVARSVIGRGETPMLHVAADNEIARRLYEKLGFAIRTTVTFESLLTPR